MASVAPQLLSALMHRSTSYPKSNQGGAKTISRNLVRQPLILSADFVP